MQNNSLANATVGAFTTQTLAAIVASFSALSAGVFTPGNIYFLDPKNGSDLTGDGTVNKPMGTLPGAYALMVAGNNDICALVGDGATDATARISKSFTWAKSAAHLIGMCPPTLYSQRARIAPKTTDASFTPFFTISGNGCIFQNVEIYAGFTTGAATSVAVVVTGDHNVFRNCHLVGMSDAASAQSAGSRSLLLSAAEENLFVDCVIGDDTIARTQANASIELAAGSARNVFRGCRVPFFGSAGGVLGILGTGAACCDRDTTFENCTFINQIKSTSTQMTVLGSFTSAAPGGMVLFKNCSMIGVTKFGDTNFLANSFLDMGVVSASAGGLMLAPT